MSGALGRVLPRFQPDHLLQQQLALINAQSNAPIVVGWVTASLTLWVFQQLAAVWVWAIWFVLYTFALVALYFVFSWSQQQRVAPRRRVWIIITGFAVLGLMWGALVVMAALNGAGLPMLALVATVVASISAAVLGICGSCSPVYLAFLLMAGSTVNIGFLIYDNSLARMLAIFATLYVLSMMQFSRSLERSALRLIELRFENRDLVTRLQTQTQNAEIAREYAEASSLDKSRFLAAASHDLRQPVHAIGLFLEALSNTDLDEKQRTIHRKAQSACDASGDMLGTLLDFSRIEAGVVKNEPRAFALQPLLAELAREYEPQAEAKRLHFTLRETPLWVYADPSLASLVVRNLISNAVRYTAKGGLLIGCRVRDGWAHIEVWDSGIGIDPAQQSNIFKEFVQLANAERNRAHGLGLGLSIVQKIVSVMGAEVTLRSRLGKGSVFTLALPLAAPSQNAQPELATAPALNPTSLQSLSSLPSLPSLAGLRVLVVEDEQELREATTELLVGWGCVSKSSNDLAGALTLLIDWTPDVVVSDYRLRDGVTGRDIMHAVRARVRPDLPCIIVTGDTAPDRLIEATESGATLLHKPLPAAQLRAALAACCVV